MALPVALRVMPQVPFPALVTGSGPVRVGKSATGVWTISFDIVDLGLQIPSPGNYANEYVIVYDAVAKNFFRLSLATIASLGGGAKSQRSVTASPIVIAATDIQLNVNISTGSPTCAIPLAASRNGVPLTFKDVGGQFSAHNLTLTFTDTIEGGAGPLVLGANRQELTITPFNDGVNSGWFI
jgi:hypothetical protein